MSGGIAVRSVQTMGIVLLLAACGAPSSPSASDLAASMPGDTSSPSASLPASPAAMATTAPTPDAQETERPPRPGWADDPPKPLLLNRAVRVLVDELNVRDEPSTSARRTGTVRVDDVLAVILYPPVEADGYLWYYGITAGSDGQLRPLPHDPFDRQDGFGGWFAALQGTTPYVEPLDPRCPGVVDRVGPHSLETLGAMLGAELLACFGDRPVEFEGTLEPPPGVPPEIWGDFEPRWLADPNFVNLVSWEADNRLWLNVRIPPSVSGRPEAGSTVHVRGHFDDSAAADCVVALDPPWGRIHPRPAPASFARLWCRQMFVVDAWEAVRA
jgi:hypothetical protein